MVRRQQRRQLGGQGPSRCSHFVLRGAVEGEEADASGLEGSEETGATIKADTAATGNEAKQDGREKKRATEEAQARLPKPLADHPKGKRETPWSWTKDTQWQKTDWEKSASAGWQEQSSWQKRRGHRGRRSSSKGAASTKAQWS